MGMERLSNGEWRLEEACKPLWTMVKDAVTIKLLTRQQVAECAQVTVRTVDRWIASGILPAVRISRGCVRVREKDWERFVSIQSVEKDPG